MKHLWIQQFPLVRLLPFMLLSCASWRAPACAICCVILATLFWKRPRVGCAMLLLFGLVIARAWQTQPPAFVKASTGQSLLGRVSGHAVTTRSGFRIDVCPLHPPSAPAIRLYARSNSKDIPKVGDLIAAHGDFTAPETAKNPGGFDPQQFYQIQHLAGTFFARHIVTKGSHTLPFSSKVKRLQAALVERLCRHLSDSNARQILPALVLGDRSAMERDTKHVFSKAGAIHVLAVSGMHLGLVYAMLAFVLKRLLPGRANRLRAILEIAGIWSFALLTGAAPSACRAALLITGLVLGRSMARKADTLNTLAGTALLQLFLDPHLLFNIGFQLSYSAVAGIVLFEPQLRTDWKLPKWAEWMGTSMRVSTAAQLGTLPLVLLHFEQFPCYSALSSLVVVPAAGALLALGLGTIITAPFGMGEALAGLLESLTQLTWRSVSCISEWPGALWKSPGFTGIAASALALALLCWKSKELLPYRWRIGMGLALMTAAFAPYCWRVRQHANHSQLAILHSFHNSELAYRSCTPLVMNQGKVSNDALRFLGSGKVKVQDWKEECPITIVGGVVALRLVDVRGLKLGPMADVVLVEMPVPKSEKPSGGGLWVVPAHLKAWERKKWVDLLQQQELAYWDVGTQGAWISSVEAVLARRTPHKCPTCLDQ